MPEVRPIQQAVRSPERAGAAAQPAWPLPGVSRGRRWETLLVGMAALVGQRLVFGALVLISIIFLSHLGLGMARGTPFRPALGRAVSRTLAYLSRLAHGDLGLSAAGSITLRPIPVAEAVRGWRAAKWSPSRRSRNSSRRSMAFPRRSRSRR